MKGTLFSADFVKNPTDNSLRLLEYNTDTDFMSASLDHFNWDEFKSVLIDNNITSIDVIYKSFQEYAVTNLSESIQSTLSNIEFNHHVELDNTIYPTDINESGNNFVLRFAYNEAAIFDSEYCKNNLNTYKLFTDSNTEDTQLVIEHYVSSSTIGYEFDNLDREYFNSANKPDLTIKKYEYSEGPSMDFYKIGNSSDTSDVRYSNFISAEYSDSDLISKYYDTSDGTNYMHSYRYCGILYGTNLDIIDIAMYKAKAFLDLPLSINFDDTLISNKINNKHRFEFATNWFKMDYQLQGGIHSEATLVSSSNEIVSVGEAIVGDTYTSLHVDGLPDTDDLNTILNWSHTGSALPVGTYETSSVLLNNDSAPLQYGVLTELVTANSSSVMVGTALPILAYDIDDDKVVFEYAHELLTDRYKLFDSSGSLVDIVSNNLVVFENQETIHELNFEQDDTFMINNMGILLVAHNIRYVPSTITCFLAGTMITMADGSKKPIENIIVGDLVKSYDMVTGEFTNKNVTDIDHRHKVGDHKNSCEKLGDSCGVYNIEGTNVHFTPEHPFLLTDGRWASLDQLVEQEPWKSEQTELVNLKVGDVVKIEEGEYKIENIIFKPTDENTTVYNFTVNDTHTYIADGFIVHNK